MQNFYLLECTEEIYETVDLIGWVGRSSSMANQCKFKKRVLNSRKSWCACSKSSFPFFCSEKFDCKSILLELLFFSYFILNKCFNFCYMVRRRLNTFLHKPRCKNVSQILYVLWHVFSFFKSDLRKTQVSVSFFFVKNHLYWPII